MTRLLPLLLLSAFSAPLWAEPVGDAVRIIKISDLNLSSVAGLRTLDRRLAIAIVDACGEASPANLAGQNQVRVCKVETRARVRAERDRIVAERTGSAKAQLAAR